MEDFFKFCGLLRISELYLYSKFNLIKCAPILSPLSITLIRNKEITKHPTWSSNLKRNLSQAFKIMVKIVFYLAILTITCLCLKSVTSFGSPFNHKFRFNEIKWLKRHIELEKQKTAIIASVSTKNFEDTITLGLLRMLKVS